MGCEYRRIPWRTALLRAFGGGIAAPSANRFGRISPTTAQHVRDELGDRVDLILDGGACEVGIESTIIDLSSGDALSCCVPARIAKEDIEALLGVPVGAQHGGVTARVRDARSALCTALAAAARATATGSRRWCVNRARCGSWRCWRAGRSPRVPVGHWQQAPSDPVGYAHELYAALRQLDDSGCDLIIVESPPDTPAWAAVRDRLQRAAAGRAESGRGMHVVPSRA